MKPAEFEERDYETPLYNQLERSDPRLWTPGQVLEERLGFDHARFVGENALWQLHGYRAPLAGILLPSIPQGRHWGPLKRSTKLPSFAFNVFLQAKRSQWTRRRPKIARHLASTGVTWGFEVNEKQQRTLDVLASHCVGHALVAYAAPAFHTRDDLYSKIIAEAIPSSSTFPSVITLSGHERWIYCGPGCTGVANPDPVPVEEPPLLDRIQEAAERRRRTARDFAPETELAELFGGITAAVRSDLRPADAQTAQFFEQLRLLDRVIATTDASELLANYLRVAHAVLSFNLLWLTVAD